MINSDSGYGWPSKIWGGKIPPKMDGEIRENPIRIDDLGGPPSHPNSWKYPYTTTLCCASLKF